VVPTTCFTDPAAVDAWDRWFRWRDARGTRDRTIDATWWRVARATAASAGWAERYADAFSRWQLLPDERLLKSAGTGVPSPAWDALSATLNVASFVRAPRTPRARFDRESFSGIAGLAVRLLDDALVHAEAADTAGVHTSAPPPPAGIPDVASAAPRLHIGVLGLADALHLLGVDYDSPAAAAMAAQVGQALAEGTLAASVELARERGARVVPVLTPLLMRGRVLPLALARDLQRYGLRHGRLTAIERQPRLALLANRASDALCPSPLRARAQPVSAMAAWLAVGRAPLDADAACRPGQPEAECTGSERLGSERLGSERLVAAQQALRAAIRPWIDAPIDYPLGALSRVG